MPAVSIGRERGALAIVLHTHMPYVEGFGTWPFGEEWLWEAMVGCYLPLLDLLDEGAPLTLSITPVLCDQLEAPDLAERFAEFVEGVRRDTHEEDAAGLRAGGHETLALELERSMTDYTRALESLRRRGGELLGSFARHAQWASSATHAILPLLATDAGLRLQVGSGVGAHRRRFGGSWRGGFWLPECAYAPWLERSLEGAGVSAACVELTNRLGLGAREHLRPIATESGVLLMPIDRSTISLVWSDDGYPANGSYRDYHHHTVHHHNPWSNDGGAYDHELANARAREHAADFVARTLARLRDANDPADVRGAGGSGSPLPGGGWWCVRWTPSCSGTGGMRESPGCAPSSRSARAKIWSWCAWTTRSSAASRSCSRPSLPAAGHPARGAPVGTCRPGPGPPWRRWPSRCAPVSCRWWPPASAPAQRPCASYSRCRPATGRS